MTKIGNIALIEALQEKLRELPEPKLVVRGKGGGHRTNNPIQPFLGRCRHVSREALEKALETEAEDFNAAIGLTAAEERVATTGIAGLVLQLDPGNALRAYDELAKKGARPTITDIAAQLLGLPETTAIALLAGPSWAGERAGWIRPDEAAEAAEKAATKAAASNVWDHLKRQVILNLESGFRPGEEAFMRRQKWYHDGEGANRSEEEIRVWVNDAFPETYINEAATVDATVLIGDGAHVGNQAEIGRLVRIGEGSIIGANAKLNMHAVVGDNTRVGCNAHVEAHAQIENGAILNEGTKVGERATVGDHARLADDAQIRAKVTIGTGAKIGASAIIEEEATVGAQTAIGMKAQIGAGVTIGSNCRIGHNAMVTKADINDYTMVPAKAEITDGAEAEAYSIEYSTEL